jgi:hypothetical protein
MSKTNNKLTSSNKIKSSSRSRSRSSSRSRTRSIVSEIEDEVGINIERVSDYEDSDDDDPIQNEYDIQLSYATKQFMEPIQKFIQNLNNISNTDKHFMLITGLKHLNKINNRIKRQTQYCDTFKKSKICVHLLNRLTNLRNVLHTNLSDKYGHINKFYGGSKKYSKKKQINYKKRTLKRS